MRALLASCLVVFVLAGTAQAQWMEADIGGSMPVGYGFDGWEIEVYGGGAGIGGTSDQFFFFYEEAVGDDITLIAQLTGLLADNPAVTTQAAGLMIRDSLNADSANAAIMLNLDFDNGGADALWRDVAGAGTQDSTASTFGDGLGLYDYLKVTRSGDQFDFAVSTDSVNWTSYGAQTVQMGGSVFIGIAVTSDEQDVGVTAYMADYEATGDFTKVTAMVWDGTGNGNWGDPSRWNDPTGVPTNLAPDQMTNTTVDVNNTISVLTDQTTNELTMTAGTLDISPNVSFTAGGVIDIAEDVPVILGADATFSTGGGNMGMLITNGSPTLGATADLSVVSLDTQDSGGTFTKQGPGNLELNNTEGTGVFIDSGTTVRVEGGTIVSTGLKPIGDTELIELAGGSLEFSTGAASPTISINFGADEPSGARSDVTGAAGVSGSTNWNNLDLDAGGPTTLIDDKGTMTATTVTWSADGAGTWSSWGRGEENNDAPDGNDRNLMTGYLDTTDVSVTTVTVDGLGTDYTDLGYDVYVYIHGGVNGRSGNYTIGGTTLHHQVPAAFDGNYILGEFGNYIVFEDLIDPTFDLSAVADNFRAPINGVEIVAELDPSAPGANLAMGTTDVVVSDDSGITVYSGLSAEFGHLTMQSGILTTAGSAAISFAGTTIEPADGATVVGFAPEVDTDFGGIDALGAEIIIAKGGSSTWVMNTPPANIQNITWEVQDGVLQPTDAGSLGGRPVTITGGELLSVGAAPLGNSDVVLDGGELTIVNEEQQLGGPGLQERWFSGDFDDDQLTPVDSGVGFLTMSPDAYSMLDTELSFDGPAMEARSGGAVGNNDIGAVWYGQVNIGGDSPLAAGRNGFGLNTDDGGMIWVDVDQSGTFDAGEMIVDTRGNHPTLIGVGAVDLAEGSYDIAFAYYENAGGELAEMKVFTQTPPPDAMLQANADLFYSVSPLVDPSSPEQAGLWTAYESTPLVMTDRDLTVLSDSSLNASTGSAASFGHLSLGGVLTTRGAYGGISFTGTTLSDATGGFDTVVDANPGVIDGGSMAATIVKTGAASLVIDQAGVGLQNATFDVQEGAIVPLVGAASFGGGAVNLSGGELLLTSTGGDVTLDQAVSVSASSTITAGSGGHGVPGPLTATLGSAANGIAVNGGTLVLGSVDNHTLNVAGLISGADAGAVSINSGPVLLSGGGSIANATIGRSAVVDTAGGGLDVTGTLNLDKVVYTVNSGAVTLKGSNLAAGSATIMLADSDVTVSATLMPEGAVLYYSFDDETDPGHDDSGNGFDGTLGVDATWVPDGRMGGAMEFDSYESYVQAATFDLTTNTITMSGWVNGDKNGDWAALMSSRSGPANALGFGNTDNVHYHWNDDAAAYNWDSGLYIDRNEWVFMAVTVEPDRATAYYWSEAGGLVSAENVMAHPEQTLGDLYIGRDNCCGDTRFVVGMIDEPRIYDRVLDAEEIMALIQGIDDPSAATAENSVIVSGSSTLSADFGGVMALGDLALEQDAQLTLQQVAAASFNDVTSADGTVVGNIAVRGTLLAGNEPGTLHVTGEVTMADGAIFSATLLGAAGADKLIADGDVDLGTNATLEIPITAEAPFKAGTYTLIDSNNSETGVIGLFASMTDLGGYAGANALQHNEFDVKLTIDLDLHPGDADLSTATDLTDFNIWNANKFTAGTDWTAGDFNGDGQTDLSDFNIWNANKFTTAAGGAAPTPTQVPEPGTLALLACGLLGLFLARRRQKAQVA